MSGWLLNTVSFSSPLIARPDTLWRQWTNLFIKSGVWLPPLRASLSSWYHSCGDKEQGTGDRHLYIRRQWSVWVSPGTKEKPPTFDRRDTPPCFVVGSESIPPCSRGSVAWFWTARSVPLYICEAGRFLQLSILSGHSVASSCEGPRGKGLLLKNPAGQCDRAKDAENKSVLWLSGVEQHKETKRQADIWLLCLVLFFPAPVHNTQMFSLCIDYAGPRKSKK